MEATMTEIMCGTRELPELPCRHDGHAALAYRLEMWESSDNTPVYPSDPFYVFVWAILGLRGRAQRERVPWRLVQGRVLIQPDTVEILSTEQYVVDAMTHRHSMPRRPSRERDRRRWRCSIADGPNRDRGRVGALNRRG
jgi:hypothetical protein